MGENMGFLDKVKNLFTEPEDEFDDEEIEIEQINKEKPVKEKVVKERPVVEKPVIEKKRERFVEEEETREFVEPELDFEEPKEEVKKVEVEPAPQPKTRESLKTPIFFTENDFADLEPERPKKVEKKREVEYRTPQKKEEKKQPYGGAFSSTTILTTEKQTFKPTPIISPIWGVLDKNYSKEDIVERNEEREGGKSNLDRFDQVRNKAYGRLENDLEDTIYSAPKHPTKKAKIEEEIDLFDELETESIKKETKVEPKTEEIRTVDLSRNVREQENNIKDLEETTMDLTKELDNLLLQRETYSDKKKKIEKETSKDDLLTENELFNIIDSIYEEGKE